jgi:hypothetical protein
MGVADWWVPKVDLEDGESSRANWMANFTDGPWNTIGGKLELTDRRLVFRPGRADRALGSKVWSVPLAEITELGRVPRTWNPFDGGLRTRLRVSTRDGAVHLFVVSSLDKVIAALDEARAAPR